MLTKDYSCRLNDPKRILHVRGGDRACFQASEHVAAHTIRLLGLIGLNPKDTRAAAQSALLVRAGKCRRWRLAARRRCGEDEWLETVLVGDGVSRVE
jgi:hypothetical protein